MTRAARLDFWVAVEVGVPIDTGFMIVVLHPDDTATRTCKGCGVSVTTAYDPQTRDVVPAAIDHHAGCRVIAWLTS